MFPSDILKMESSTAVAGRRRERRSNNILVVGRFGRDKVLRQEWREVFSKKREEI